MTDPKSPSQAWDEVLDAVAHCWLTWWFGPIWTCRVTMVSTLPGERPTVDHWTVRSRTQCRAFEKALREANRMNRGPWRSVTIEPAATLQPKDPQ